MLHAQLGFLFLAGNITLALFQSFIKNKTILEKYFPQLTGDLSGKKTREKPWLSMILHVISLTVCFHIALGYIHTWEHWSNSSDRFLPNFYEKGIKRTQLGAGQHFWIGWHTTVNGNNRQSNHDTIWNDNGSFFHRCKWGRLKTESLKYVLLWWQQRKK